MKKEIQILTKCPHCNFHNPVVINLENDPRSGVKLVTCHNIIEKPEVEKMEVEERQELMDTKGVEALYDRKCTNLYVVSYEFEFKGRSHKIEGL